MSDEQQYTHDQTHEATEPPEELGATELVQETSYAGGRRRKKRGISGCLAVLVALAVLVGGFYVAVTRGVDWVSGQFSSAEDFPGPGRGSVTFEVEEGDTTA
jgi:UPF0755 protein